MILSNALFCLAMTVYYEARGEPAKGQIAVAHVVLNRAAATEYPDDICSVVFDKHQFSWTNEKVSKPKGQAWIKSIAIARAAMDGSWPDPTRGAKHFHSIKIAPAWSFGRHRPQRIGNHIFYR